MPCLILTGHPSSGKTTMAHKLRDRALVRNELDHVVLLSGVDEPHVLKATLARQVRSPRTLVVVDALNALKGVRYELYCLNKEAKDSHGVLWVLNDVEQSRVWNEQRGGNEKYDNFDELVRRYEPPDPRNRWDAPLYKVGSVTAAREILGHSLYNMHELKSAMLSTSKTTVDDEPSVVPQSTVVAAPKTTRSVFKKAKGAVPIRPTQKSTDTLILPDELKAPNTAAAAEVPPPTKPRILHDETPSDLPLEAQLDQILDAFLAQKALEEGTSTITPIASETNVLHTVDVLTQQVLAALAQPQERWTLGGRTYEPCHRPLSELRRARQQYLSWIAINPPDDTSEQGIVDSFLAYLQS